MVSKQFSIARGVGVLVMSLALVSWAGCTSSGVGGDDDDDIVDTVDSGVVGAPDAGDNPQSCPEQAEGIAGNHIVVDVSWSATTGLNAGSGQLHIWTMAELTFDGTDVTGVVRPCGSVVPPMEKAALVGGGQMQTVIPDEVWDAPSMPTFQASGTISGFDVGSTITMDPVASLVGLTMDDPMNGAWPPTGAEVNAVDHDGSGKPGITAIPRSDPPFSLPPLDLIGALLPNGARGDVLGIVTRSVIELHGTRDTCTSARGSATVHVFNNHVVGCHVLDGGDCNADQVNFVDSNRVVYQIGDASYTMKRLEDGATCADVRAALP